MVATHNLGKPQQSSIYLYIFLHALPGIYEPEMATFYPHHERSVGRLATRQCQVNFARNRTSSDLSQTAPDCLTSAICGPRSLLGSETPLHEGAVAMPLPIEHITPRRNLPCHDQEWLAPSLLCTLLNFQSISAESAPDSIESTCSPAATPVNVATVLPQFLFSRRVTQCRQCSSIAIMGSVGTRLWSRC